VNSKNPSYHELEIVSDLPVEILENDVLDRFPDNPGTEQADADFTAFSHADPFRKLEIGSRFGRPATRLI
jgi:hypothetical protein